MKIAYLFSRYPVPSQTFCDTEIRALEAAGHEIEIYSCSAPTTSFRHGGPADWPRARVHYAPPASVLAAWEGAARQEGTWPGEMVDDHAARFGSRYDPARRARHALYFANLLRRQGVEHVHIHFANRATHAALFLHQLTGVPFSFTAHAQDFLVDLGNDDLLRLMCERAAFVVAVSEWSRRALVERCPAAEAKIHRVYNGLELDRWDLPVEPTPLPNQPLRIFSVGRLIDFKGFQDLVAACRLLKERGVPFCCEIAGEGPLREALEREIAEFSGPGAKVRLSGLLSQAQVQVCMGRCDVFALASCVDEKGACDVLPTVILEAMACAKPVVSTSVAGIPEMIEPARSGLLVPPNRPDLLADALTELSNDEVRRRELGRVGQAKVRTQFSSAGSAQQLSALFRTAKDASDSFRVTSFKTEPPTLCCLFDRWPTMVGDPPFLDDSTLADLRRIQPTAMLALAPGEFDGSTVNTALALGRELLPAVEYLPDALVLENHWRQDTTLAHRLEGWRGEVGGACTTDDYLLACRRALYIQRAGWLNPGASLHLHAVGPGALLCGWLLKRLGVVHTASFLLSPAPAKGTGLAGSTLRKLAPAFVGGWVVQQRKLAESLGVIFKAEQPEPAAWLSALAGWSAQGKAL